jgi:transcriptional regulator with XRE-family HTH domain
VQITRLRNGLNKPSRETALKLAEVTGIPASTLIFGQDVAA